MGGILGRFTIEYFLAIWYTVYIKLMLKIGEDIMKKTLSILCLALALVTLCGVFSGCFFIAIGPSADDDGFPDPDEAYTVEYLSNGDGTCKAIVFVDAFYREQYELIIPDESPEGDTVTEVDFDDAFGEYRCSFPTIMRPETYQAVLDELEANVEGGRNSKIWQRVAGFFVTYNLDTANSAMKSAVLKEYPFIEYARSVTVFDEAAKHKEYELISGYIDDHTSFNTLELARTEYQAFVDVLKENGIAEDKIGDYIPEIHRCEELPTSMYITAITLPKGLVTVSADDMVNFSVSSVIVPKSADKDTVLAFANMPGVEQGDCSVYLLADKYPQYLLAYDEDLEEYVEDYRYGYVYSYRTTEPSMEAEEKGNYWRYDEDEIPLEW